MKESIQTLVDLQTIDLQVNKIDNQMVGLKAELDKRQVLVVQLKKSVQLMEEKFQALEVERHGLETLITDETVRMKDRQAKLMNVQTNREYQSLLKEIEDIKTANKQREDEIMRLMEAGESLKNKIVALQNQSGSEEHSLGDEVGKVDEQLHKLAAEKDEIIKHRAIAAENVNAQYLRKYELLRERRNGVAVVGVTKGVCRGCNMNLPPQLFNNLLKDLDLLSCPTCNRMIFHEPDDGNS